MSRTTVLLADDHAVVAAGIASLLKDEFDLVGIVADGQALVAAATRLRPDVIVADITMPLASGLDAARQLSAAGATSKIVFLTMHDDPQLAAEAFRAGASGYLPKNSAGEELILAIQEVVRGRAYLSPLITRDVMSALTTEAPTVARQTTLRPRQIEVLRLVAQGKRMKEIAAQLGLSARTVESHKYEMMQALGVTSTAQLVQHAIRMGLLAFDGGSPEPARERQP